MVLSQAHNDQFRHDGYWVVEDFISSAQPARIARWKGQVIELPTLYARDSVFGLQATATTVK